MADLWHAQIESSATTLSPLIIRIFVGISRDVEKHKTVMEPTTLLVVIWSGGRAGIEAGLGNAIAGITNYSLECLRPSG